MKESWLEEEERESRVTPSGRQESLGDGRCLTPFPVSGAIRWQSSMAVVEQEVIGVIHKEANNTLAFEDVNASRSSCITR